MGQELGIINASDNGGFQRPKSLPRAEEVSERDNFSQVRIV